MMNLMTIDGYRAVIQHDPDIAMFRGEFVGLNGGADFYAKDLDGLRHEGQVSLRVFLDACAERSIEPRKSLSTHQDSVTQTTEHTNHAHPFD